MRVSTPRAFSMPTVRTSSRRRAPNTWAWSSTMRSSLRVMKPSRSNSSAVAPRASSSSKRILFSADMGPSRVRLNAPLVNQSINAFIKGRQTRGPKPLTAGPAGLARLLQSESERAISAAPREAPAWPWHPPPDPGAPAMQIDIKTQGIEPVRPAYDQLVRRLGPRKLPNRYQEATYDLQDEATFHYLPLWDEGRQIFDAGRTAVVMADWYDLLDPRQYYYGSWTLARARQQEHTEHAFAFAGEQGAFAGLDGEAVAALTRYLLPFRHVEYGANLNNCYLT